MSRSIRSVIDQAGKSESNSWERRLHPLARSNRQTRQTACLFERLRLSRTQVSSRRMRTFLLWLSSSKPSVVIRAPLLVDETNGCFGHFGDIYKGRGVPERQPDSFASVHNLCFQKHASNGQALGETSMKSSSSISPNLHDLLYGLPHPLAVVFPGQ